jgi:aspartyl/asparaginyl beta-hydroxylase (cupin superfamily)
MKPDRWLALQDRLIERTRDGRRAFFETVRFPWVAELEQSWQQIRVELDRVLRHVELAPNFQELQPEHRVVTHDDGWKVFIFFGCGIPATENLRRCPHTARLLRAIPGMQNAMFSILRAHKHLPPHRGPYKGLLRYHLGLKVPPSGCRITLAGETRTWQEGKSLIFDDTHRHEVWNDSDEDRVVLFVDFLRPLPLPLKAVNLALLKVLRGTPFIQSAVARHQAWEKKFGHAFD